MNRNRRQQNKRLIELAINRHFYYLLYCTEDYGDNNYSGKKRIRKGKTVKKSSLVFLSFTFFLRIFLLLIIVYSIEVSGFFLMSRFKETRASWGVREAFLLTFYFYFYFYSFFLRKDEHRCNGRRTIYCESIALRTIHFLLPKHFIA